MARRIRASRARVLRVDLSSTAGSPRAPPRRSARASSPPAWTLEPVPDRGARPASAVRDGRPGPAEGHGPGLEHPRGRQELILTNLSEGRSGYGLLRLAEAGFYVLIEQSSGGHSVAELDTAGDADVLLPPGRYLVRRRGRKAVHEAVADVAAGAEVQVAAADMTRIPDGRTARKGLGVSELAWSVGAAFEAAGPLLDDVSPGLFGAVGVQLDTEPLSVELRLRYGRAAAENLDVALTQDAIGVDVGLFKIFDLDAANLGIGIGIRIGIGFDWVGQSFATEGEAPSWWELAGRLAPVARLEWAPISPGPDLGRPRRPRRRVGGHRPGREPAQ